MDNTEQQLLQALDQQEQALTEQDLKKDYVANAGNPLAEGAKPASKEDIINALKTVQDPEIGINIYDLGLIYNIHIKDNGNVNINMTVTTPMCPVAGILPMHAAHAVAATEGVGVVEVKIVWEPTWTPDRMTDDAKMMFEMF